MIKKTQDCQACQYSGFHVDTENIYAKTLLFCNLKQKYIKFYQPKSETDENYGFKAKCNDFKPEEKEKLVWNNLNEFLPLKNCNVILYDIRNDNYRIAKFKDNLFEVSQIGDTPVCLNEISYKYFFWHELPTFNKKNVK